jgi:hypothetical protein
MRSTPWTDEHDRLLTRAAPETATPDDAALDRVWNRVAAGLTHSRPRRRRGRIAVGLAIGAVLLGTSGLAAADLYTAHTGKGPADSEDLRLGGPGERLDPAAPDYGKVVARETRDIPFPSVAARAVAVEDQVHDARFATPGGERVAVGAIRAWVADAALCSWSNQWAAATRGGDEAARDEAIRVIHQAPGWSAVTAIDPHPYTRTKTLKVTDPQGNTTPQTFRDDSQFFYLAELGRAVEGANTSAVAKVLAENNGYCRPALVPDLPHADPMYRGH